jgi:hypothetical protein
MTSIWKGRQIVKQGCMKVGIRRSEASLDGPALCGKGDISISGRGEKAEGWGSQHGGRSL